jgi:ribonuclease PH
MRAIEVVAGCQEYAEGSVQITLGRTRVLCAATVEDGVPSWAGGEGNGWVSAEYAMLPRSTRTRTRRDHSVRETEIEQLLGRALRASLDLYALGRRTVTVDCDVIQADGGTRTAAVTGGYVALALAVKHLVRRNEVTPQVWRPPIAAISVGVVDGEMLLDLCHEEDIRAMVDCNVVMNARGELIEVGAPAAEPYRREQLDRMLDLASGAIQQIVEKQQRLLGRHEP